MLAVSDIPEHDFSESVAEALTAAEKLRRFVTLGEWDTAGPEPHPDIVDVVPPPHPCWTNGWWEHAIQRPAHPKRVGGSIAPFAIVAHSCDMLHDEFDALINAMTTKAGEGNAFHFCIGPTPAQGVVQCVPVNRNANHAGGKGHGEFFDATGRTYHPNLVAVGIEFHCAGGVRRVAGQWRLVEGGKAHGRPIPDSEVTADPGRPGRGWHNLTDYQRERWTALASDLEPVMATMPKGLGSRSLVEKAPVWAVMPIGQRIAGHVSLDTARRSDPWPPAMDWLRAK